ncbi:helix-turn-helix transcriptional regulator [uncultured Senegalimassilia sp.]|uniref:helix-turn-helix domain-containing protein n=1 Tax=uncultured Senegalimassilia sp. TaxID=1714350 RepID=UPI0027DB53BC|nr:helix-turn-helix transcriptional regulator [uncultured Senegalimassilia sp.]
MAMKVSLEEFLGVDEAPKPSFETVAAKMALDFESEVFLHMKKLGIRQKDLAKLMGVTPPAVSKLLSNTSNLTFKTIAKIAVAMGCTVSPITLNQTSEISYAKLEDEAEVSAPISLPSTPAQSFSSYAPSKGTQTQPIKADETLKQMGTISLRRMVA